MRDESKATEAHNSRAFIPPLCFSELMSEPFDE